MGIDGGKDDVGVKLIVATAVCVLVKGSQESVGE